MRTLIGLFAVALLPGCYGTLEPPDSRSDAAGVITQVQSGTVFRVLIERDPGEPIGEKVWFTVNDGTDILVRQPDETWRPGTRSELQVGVRATGWADGPIAESYPAQATASDIIVFP